jgi:hypothetical protein
MRILLVSDVGIKNAYRIRNHKAKCSFVVEGSLPEREEWQKRAIIQVNNG